MNLLKEINFNRRKFFILFFIIFTLRIILNFYGFDTVPFLSHNDEVIIQDPSIYLNKIGEFKALSFYGYLIDKLDSHHPPLFVWLQSKFFSIFGLNQYSLRIPAIFYSVISLSLIAYSLCLLPSIGLTSINLSNLFTIIIILDPTYLSWSRFGRNDCLANLFLSGAIYLILIGYKKSIYRYLLIRDFSKKELISNFMRHYIPASILIGLSVATHLQYIFGYIFLIAYLFLIAIYFIPLKNIYFILMVSPFVTFLIWFLAFKNNLLLSIEVLNAIQSKFSGVNSFILGINSIFKYGNFNPQIFSHKGGTLLILNFFGYLLALLIFTNLISKYLKDKNKYNLKNIRISSYSEKLNINNINQKWIFLSVFTIFCHITLLIFKYGINTSRFYSFIPISSILIPIMIFYLIQKNNIRYFKYLSSLILFSFLLVNIILTSSYFNLVNYRISDPKNNYSQIEKSIKNLSSKVKLGVAAPPNFWLALHKKMENKNIHIIDNGFKIEDYLSNSKKFKNIEEQEIDWIIVNKNSDLIKSIERSNSFKKIENILRIKNDTYFFYKQN